MYILGVKIDNLTMEEAVRRAYGFLYDSKQHYIVTPNPEIVIHSAKNPVFRRVLNRSSLSLPDGIGIVLASKIFYRKTSIKERVPGVDFMCGFLEYVHKKAIQNSDLPVKRGGRVSKAHSISLMREPFRILLVGGSVNTARRTAEIFRQRFFGLKFYSIENFDSEQSDFVIKNIINPDIIFVALGAPRQEMWVYKNLKKIPTVKIAMGVGGAFDFISGRIPRAPKKLQKAGAEWLWRLAIEPRRLCRIFNAVIIFPVAVIKEKYLSAIR